MTDGVTFLSGKCEEGRTGSALDFANDFDLKTDMVSSKIIQIPFERILTFGMTRK